MNFPKMGRSKEKVEDIKIEKTTKINRDYRKIFKYIFWSLFILLISYSIFSMTKMSGTFSKLNKLEKELVEIKSIKEEQQVEFNNVEGAKQFALDYAELFFSWNKEGENLKTRKDSLSKFTSNTESIETGLFVESSTLNSRFISADVVGTEILSNDVLSVELRVVYQPYEIQTKDKKKVEVTKDNETVYVRVNVNEIERSFTIFDSPFLVASPKAVEIKQEAKLDEELNNKIDDASKIQDYQEFIETFFKVYTTQSDIELSYYLDKNLELNSLANNFVFLEVNDIKLYKEDDSYRVITTISLKDSVTNAVLKTKYSLLVKEKDGRLILADIENK